MRNPRDILIIKPSSLGDVVHTIPALALIKKQWPDARIRWLINREWAPLLEGNPHLHETVIFPRGEFRGIVGLSKIPTWASKMRREQRADLVLDFQGLLRSALIGRLCRSGELVGLSDAREGARFLYDRTANVRGIQHAVDRYLALAECLGIDTRQALEWDLPAGTPPQGFAVPSPFILLHPFSRGAGKSLSVEDIGLFCRKVAPASVGVVGRSSEHLPHMDNVTNLVNRTTVTELIWLLREASFIVSVDSGPMHIAAALTPRLLSIHTWSDPRKVGPYRPEAWVWKDGSLFQMKDILLPETHRSVASVREIAGLVHGLL